ncbi:hypothetical protein [Posidoniimonas polymericola]|nr:hypothetical protein [Posidoniimonas polymericola]
MKSLRGRPGWRLAYAAPVLALLFSSPARGQVSWANPGAGDWSNGLNWSSGVTPGTQDAALVANGGHAQANASAVVAVNRLEVGRNDGSGAFTSNGAAVEIDSAFDVGEVTGAAATGGLSVSNSGTVVIQDSALLEVGVNNGGGDFDIGQTGATLGGTALSMASVSLVRHGLVDIATNLEVAPASADATSTSTANGQFLVEAAESISIAAELNVGTVNGSGRTSSTALASFQSVGSMVVGAAANIGVAKGTSQLGNSADATLTIHSSSVQIGFAEPLALEDLNIGDVSTVGSGVLHGKGLVQLNDSQLTVGNRIDVARLTGGAAASTTDGRLEAVGSLVIADDLTVAEVGAGVLGTATGVVDLSKSLVDLGSTLRLGEGSTLEIALSGVSRADGSGGLQYAAIDAGLLADLAGSLRVTLADGFLPSVGQSFLLIGTPTVTGDFSGVELPDLINLGMDWTTTIGPTGYSVSVVGAALPGDYNGDGLVDGADYSVWRDSNGSTLNLAADGDGDLVVDAADYQVWRSHYGRGSLTSPAAVGTAAPEPSALAVVIAAAALQCFVRRKEQ